MLTESQWFVAILSLIVATVLYFLIRKSRGQINTIDNSKIRIAVVCLTRGYNDLSLYEPLINRNKSLVKFTNELKNQYQYQVDNLLFHEGNIPPDHQAHIQQATPDWTIKFINVHTAGNGKAFNTANVDNAKDTPLIYATKTSEFFAAGYKHMCHFWFIDFMHYLKEYNYSVRVDEDCIVTNFPVNIFNKIQRLGYVFVTPTYDAPDIPDVTVGLQATATDFMTKNGLVEKIKLREYKKTPYTNVCIIDIQYFLHSDLYLKFTKHIDSTNGIYINRWGDLPLWAYFLANIVPKAKYALSKKIRYYHGSHKRSVN